MDLLKAIFEGLEIAALKLAGIAAGIGIVIGAVVILVIRSC